MSWVVISPNSSAAVRLEELGDSNIVDSLDDMRIRDKERAKVESFLPPKHASTRHLIIGDAGKCKMMEALDPQWNGKLPDTLLIGADGKVLHRFSGALDFNEWRRHIVPALNAVVPWKPTGAPL